MRRSEGNRIELYRRLYLVRRLSSALQWAAASEPNASIRLMKATLCSSPSRKWPRCDSASTWPPPTKQREDMRGATGRGEGL